MINAVSQETQRIFDLMLNVYNFVFEVDGEGLVHRALMKGQGENPELNTRLLGKPIVSFISQEAVEDCLQLIRNAAHLGETGYIEYSQANEENTMVKYGIRTLPFSAVPGHCLILAEDITTRDNLEHVEDRWRMALDAVGDGMWDADLVRGTVFFSDKWYQMTGYRPYQVPGTSEAWSEKVHPDDMRMAKAALNDYLAGKTPTYSCEVRYRLKSGEFCWMLSRGIVVSRDAQGKPTRLIGTHTDIHERKQAEEELRIAMQKFSNAFHYSPNGMTLTGLDGALMDVNESFCHITGYSRDLLLTMCCQDITHHEDKGQDLVMREALVTRAVDKFNFEKRYVTENGRIVWTLVNVSMVWNNDGSPKHFITQVIDIDERKRMADELKRKNQELHDAHLSLENKVQQLEELNHIIGHNLRGPANNLKLLIGAMRAKEGLPTDQNSSGLQVLDTDELLDLMEKSSKAQGNTLDTLMQLTQIGLNKDIPFDECDVEEVAHEVVQQLQAVVAIKKARIRYDLNVKTLSYPKVYLDSILYNLVSNALKYSRAEAVPEIVITSRKEQDVNTITVRDNGLGIDLSMYGHKIFKLNQIFHQGYDSKGVGLFITKAQIEALGGTIQVTSQPNVGTEFTVQI